jgi:hypothetical protein
MSLSKGDYWDTWDIEGTGSDFSRAFFLALNGIRGFLESSLINDTVNF